jgi:hypothetical protein
MCFAITGFAGNSGALCIARESQEFADFIAPNGYFESMTRMNAEERKARDAAFAEL